MKNKKHRDYFNAAACLIGLHILRALVVPHRHRRLLLPFFSAVAASLLFLFALLFFVNDLTPATFSPFLRNAIEKRVYARKEIGFRVPRNAGSLGRADLWTTNQSVHYYGCSNATHSSPFPSAQVSTEPNRYLLIATSGGLNQQRTGITDAVVAAHILNATLVVPTLDRESYWKDSSNFSDIFDVDWFISFLSKDIKIIKELPPQGMNPIIPIRTRVPRKCNPECYHTRILPLLNKAHAVKLTKFDYRLSNQLNIDLQKLRCRTNYHALQFTDPILEMGHKLVERMRMESNRFIALHLRFEPDMLAFSGCDYGGGERERKELDAIRKRWKTLRARNPEKERRQGKCPLTPEEVGLMLRALGFGDDVHIYVASGEVYRGEESLAPLKALFPNFHSKETISTEEELAPFSNYSSRMAALDFIVCDESDVFATNNNGNMARILAGRRRYFGHKRTIRPNAKKLNGVLMNRKKMSWEEFASQVGSHEIGFMGVPKEVEAGMGEFHENPAACICDNKAIVGMEGSKEQEWSDDSENEIRQGGRGGIFVADTPELDVMLYDLF